ncbi:K02A2.6-like [Cordylochernes scorpioides]|uniref:RNA-directed DNA polymerase n=1 Tax=Cordylochernes scorpioides TaxID=51811 RepID=A0ABY6LZH4_9ARAC|nr:K02A2.6-like [Cordylochernes scorpioides]
MGIFLLIVSQNFCIRFISQNISHIFVIKKIKGSDNNTKEKKLSRNLDDDEELLIPENNDFLLEDHNASSSPVQNIPEVSNSILQKTDKSIELKQINSTLSRMEGIKPPAEFVPYSNEKKWETWRESFEIFAIAVNLESMPLVRQRAILKHIAGEKTVMIYKTFHISENDTYPNVKEMLDMLTNHFKPFKNTIQRRNAFFTCVQKEKQGIMEFVTELKHLAQECEFENLTESLIRDRLIIGILDREVKIKLLEDPQLTLPRAISIAVISESTCSQVASLNEQKMIEKIEKRNWVKDTIRMENAEAGPSGINPRRERIIEPCKLCGQRHKYGKCPAYGKKCNACGKTNHFSVVCRTKRIRNLLAESEAEESCDEINLNEVAVKTVRSDKWSAVIIINGKKTTVHLDTGAQINVLPHKVINQWPSRPEIRPTSLKAFAYGNTELPIVGKCNVLCQYGEKKGMFEFIVADVEAQTLITGDTCEKLEILRRINHINTDEMKLCSETQKILEQYHEVFQGVGLINSECKIYTKPEYSPVQVPPRRIPTSLGAEVQSELEKMVKQGIVTKIYHETEWSHPMVVVKKKSGQIRICLDPRKLNEALVGRHFQTPAPAELLHEIPKAKYYTVLDVKSAYWHIPVAKECRDLLVMTTPFGKFRYNRLPFGLKISAQIFVEKMTNIFRDSFQNITYVDDLLIYADTIQEHNKKLKGILEKAKEKNIKFDLTKAQICLTKVRFLGHVISQNGIDPEPNKIDKLITLKRPEDKKSLQRIMGLYNYLGKFIPNLAASTSNIRGILRKNVVWHWGPKQDGEFDHIKECVRNAPSLAHFDKSKMLILQCDASKDAMGAALLQEDRPLAFASASFSDSQKQYSQIEKELLSVYYGCKKFEYLLSGHTFVVQTDHQPLLPLVKKPLSDISPRLQRLVMKLIAFDFKLQYKPGKYLIVADTLSRDTHPMDELPTPFLEDKRMVKMVRVNISDEKLVAMQKDTREDPALVKVIDYVIEGWPICKKDVDEDAKIFFDFRHRLYLWNDLLCIGSAIVIPKTQRNAMLNLLHQSHQGISAIQGLARESLFWPRMSIDIAEKVKNCEICQKHQKSKIRQPLKPFPVPDYPWQTVSLDIFYIQKKPHLLVVDRYSGYPEVFTLDPPTAINVKNKLRETFARFGIPETMMSDNGPPFRSEIMTDFCIRWGFGDESMNSTVESSQGTHCYFVTSSLTESAAIIHHSPDEGSLVSKVYPLSDPTSTSIIASKSDSNSDIIKDKEFTSSQQNNLYSSNYYISNPKDESRATYSTPIPETNPSEQTLDKIEENKTSGSSHSPKICSSDLVHIYSSNLEPTMPSRKISHISEDIVVLPDEEDGTLSEQDLTTLVELPLGLMYKEEKYQEIEEICDYNENKIFLVQEEHEPGDLIITFFDNYFIELNPLTKRSCKLYLENLKSICSKEVVKAEPRMKRFRRMRRSQQKTRCRKQESSHQVTPCRRDKGLWRKKRYRREKRYWQAFAREKRSWQEKWSRRESGTDKISGFGVKSCTGERSASCMRSDSSGRSSSGEKDSPGRRGDSREKGTLTNSEDSIVPIPKETTPTPPPSRRALWAQIQREDKEYDDWFIKNLNSNSKLYLEYRLFDKKESFIASIEKELKGKGFDSDEDVHKVVQDFFHTLPKSAYKEGIYKLPERWRRSIESQGDYFE